MHSSRHSSELPPFGYQALAGADEATREAHLRRALDSMPPSTLHEAEHALRLAAFLLDIDESQGRSAELDEACAAACLHGTIHLLAMYNSVRMKKD